MEIIKIDLKQADQASIQRITNIVRAGGSVAYPTDTVYSLGVNAVNEASIKQLFKIKQRPETKPVPVIVKDIAMAKKLAFINSKTEKFLNLIWPGSVTVVLEKRGAVPDILTSGCATIGLRIPDCSFVSALMNVLNIPLTATSANLSGEPSLNDAADVARIFDKTQYKPDLVVSAGMLRKTLPSTVLDLTKPKPQILRMGPVNRNYLMSILDKLEK